MIIHQLYSRSIKANIHVILEPLPAHCNNYPTQNLVPNLALGSAQMSEYIQGYSRWKRQIYFNILSGAPLRPKVEMVGILLKILVEYSLEFKSDLKVEKRSRVHRQSISITENEFLNIPEFEQSPQSQILRIPYSRIQECLCIT